MAESDDKPDEGFVEALHGSYAQKLSVDRIILDEWTGLQQVRIFDNAMWGRVMTLDGIVQITEGDEYAYSEMLVHPVMHHLGNAERVLIIGGGDGAVAEEALKHPRIRRIDLVDIDGRVIELCREHFRQVSGNAFNDPRFNFTAGDGAAFVAEGVAEPYDLIVVDRPDPVGPAKVLFEAPFHQDLLNALTPRGVAVLQTGVPAVQAGELRDAMSLLREVAANSGIMLTVVPTYIGGHMALTWMSRETDLANPPADLEDRIAATGIKTDYYNAETHRAGFALPEFIRRLV